MAVTGKKTKPPSKLYQMLPPVKPHKLSELTLPTTLQPDSQTNELMQDFMLKAASTKNSYYIDIGARPAYRQATPKEQAEKELAVKDKSKGQNTNKTYLIETCCQTCPEIFPPLEAKPNKVIKQKVRLPKVEKKEVAPPVEVEKKEVHFVSSGPKGPRLKEICYVKTPLGKQMIYKYSNVDKTIAEDNLVIVWEDNKKAQVVSCKGKTVDPRQYAMVERANLPCEKSPVRVHDFRKSLAAKIRSRRNLRTPPRSPNKKYRKRRY